MSRFSREDLLRAFDVLSKAEFEIRGASQPRYHLEMALLRWIHMRKLVPLTELLGGVQWRTVRVRACDRVQPSALPRYGWTSRTASRSRRIQRARPRPSFRPSSGERRLPRRSP